MAEYIDAEEFITEMNDRIKSAIEWGKNADSEEIKTRAEQAIATFCEASLTARKMNKADAAPVVHAHWIQTEIIDDDDPTGINDRAAKCSNCEHIEGWFYWAKTYYHFCPNCGAKMDEEEYK